MSSSKLEFRIREAEQCLTATLVVDIGLPAANTVFALIFILESFLLASIEANWARTAHGNSMVGRSSRSRRDLARPGTSSRRQRPTELRWEAEMQVRRLLSYALGFRLSTYPIRLCPDAAADRRALS